MTAEYKVHGDVAVISMNNPPVNGLGHATRVGLTDGLAKANADAAIVQLALAAATEEALEHLRLLVIEDAGAIVEHFDGRLELVVWGSAPPAVEPDAARTPALAECPPPVADIVMKAAR